MAKIYYHDIGDYLSREEKLDIIRRAGSIEGLEWTEITPNEKNDWINQRDGLFDTLLPLAPEKKFDVKAKSVFNLYSRGLATGRDGWSYNSDSNIVTTTAQASIDYYNQVVQEKTEGKLSSLDYSTKLISWSRPVQNDLSRGVLYDASEGEVRTAMYRPFCKQALFWYNPLIERRYRVPHLFPHREAENRCICVSGVGVTKDFSCIITDFLPDLEFIGKSQCFPLYWYEENKQVEMQNLFGEANTERWRRRDGITDWMLKEVHSRFSGAKNLTKEDIFYYIYGLLHSPDYRGRFADDLRKALPHIPIMERADDFIAFSKAGRALAELHLHYEDYAHKAGVKVSEAEHDTNDEYAYYAVEKMRFPSKGNRSTILYNARITIDNIPEEAYDYVVNGKSGIEWIMERYAVTTDKKSGIQNNPNLWSREYEQPRYILDLLLSIIHVSLETQKIVKGLPKLAFPAIGEE